jgi:hypothetical protein
MSILVVELGQNWRYLEVCLLWDLQFLWDDVFSMQHPYRELIILGVTILISLGIGTLPYVDNYAHFGGQLIFILAFYYNFIFNRFSVWIIRSCCFSALHNFWKVRGVFALLIILQLRLCV